MIRHSGPVLLMSLMVLALPTAVATADDDLPELRTLLERNATAMGGRDAHAAVDSIRYELTITEPGFTVDAVYIATRDGLMRVDILADGQRIFTEALGPEGGWQWTPEDGVTPTSEDGAAALRRGIEWPGRFRTLADMAEDGGQVELVGKTEREGQHYWQVRATLPDGATKDYFIGVDNDLVVFEQARQPMHVDIDPTPVLIETRHELYAPVDGVLRPRLSVQVNADSGEEMGRTVVRRVEHNPSLAEGAFRPD